VYALGDLVRGLAQRGVSQLTSPEPELTYLSLIGMGKVGA
jgi:hypothetical protein